MSLVEGSRNASQAASPAQSTTTTTIATAAATTTTTTTTTTTAAAAAAAAAAATATAAATTTAATGCYICPYWRQPLLPNGPSYGPFFPADATCHVYANDACSARDKFNVTYATNFCDRIQCG